MRTIQELLPIFLEYAESMDKVTLEITSTAMLFPYVVNDRGLCALSYFFKRKEVITEQEEKLFDAWLGDTLGENYFYHWPQGDWKVRIEWLKEQIDDTSR